MTFEEVILVALNDGRLKTMLEIEEYLDKAGLDWSGDCMISEEGDSNKIMWFNINSEFSDAIRNLWKRGEILIKKTIPDVYLDVIDNPEDFKKLTLEEGEVRDGISWTPIMLVKRTAM